MAVHPATLHARWWTQPSVYVCACCSLSQRGLRKPFFSETDEVLGPLASSSCLVFSNTIIKLTTHTIFKLANRQGAGHPLFTPVLLETGAGERRGSKRNDSKSCPEGRRWGSQTRLSSEYNVSSALLLLLPQKRPKYPGKSKWLKLLCVYLLQEAFYSAVAQRCRIQTPNKVRNSCLVLSSC